MDIPVFHLLLEKSNKIIEKSYNIKQLPFTEFTFNDNRIVFQKDSFSNTEIKIFSQNFHAESFEYLDDNHEGFKVVVSGFFRNIFQETISLPLFLKNRRINNTTTFQNKTEEATKNRDLRFNKEKIAHNLKNVIYNIGRSRFELLMENNKQNKHLTITLSNFLMVINAGFLMKLLDYVKLRENQGPYAKHNNDMIHLGAEKKKEKVKIMLIEVFFRNVLFCFESLNEEHLIAGQSTIHVKYFSTREDIAEVNKNTPLEVKENSPQSSNFDEDDYDPYELSPSHRGKNVSLHAFYHKNLKSTGRFLKKTFEEPISTFLEVCLKKLEIFNVSKIDLFKEKLEDYDLWKLDLRRRALIQPFSLTFKSEDFTCYCLKSQKTQLKESNFYLSSTRANMSIKDLLLIYETSLFQSESIKGTEETRKNETFIGEGNNPSIYLISSSSSEEEEEKSLRHKGTRTDSQMNKNQQHFSDASVDSEERINVPLEREENIRNEIRTIFSFRSEKLEIVKKYILSHQF